MRQSPMNIIIYGKGGVGKSTFSTHLSVCLSKMGKRVLLIGCDPKTDTSSRLIRREKIRTLIDLIDMGLGGSASVSDLIVKTPSGVDVMETGGPEPGIGCSGRGVMSLCQILSRDTASSLNYDVIVFDVLGDLVCGGFVAPLRFAAANNLYIVSSEEVASLYAVNNIAKVINQPYNGNITPGGIVFNIRRNSAKMEMLEDFAGIINMSILSYIGYDQLIQEAEANEMTAIEYAPESAISKKYFDIAEHMIRQFSEPARSKPTPLSTSDFWAFVREHRKK